MGEDGVLATVRPLGKIPNLLIINEIMAFLTVEYALSERMGVYKHLIVSK